jgi:hypothetical protein
MGKPGWQREEGYSMKLPEQNTKIMPGMQQFLCSPQDETDQWDDAGTPPLQMA